MKAGVRVVGLGIASWPKQRRLGFACDRARTERKMGRRPPRELFVGTKTV